MGQQGRCRLFKVDSPVIQGSETPRPVGNVHIRRHAVVRQYLGGRNPAQLQGQFGEGYLRGGKLAGSNVGVGQARVFAVYSHRGQVVVHLLVQQRVLEHRPRRHHPHHVAVYDPFGSRRVAELLADGYLVSFSHQPDEIRLQRVGWHARHRHPEIPAEVAASEGDVQLAGDQAGIIVERLVEIAHAKQDDGIPVGVLDFQVLAAYRSHGKAFQRGMIVPIL